MVSCGCAGFVVRNASQPVELRAPGGRERFVKTIPEQRMRESASGVFAGYEYAGTDGFAGAFRYLVGLKAECDAQRIAGELSSQNRSGFEHEPRSLRQVRQMLVDHLSE